MPQTYRQLLQNMTEEQLDQTITLYVDGEYLPAEALTTDENDVLDENHVYLKPERDQ